MDVWARVAQTRTELIEQLEGIDPSRWDGRSLCERWRVRDVVAHLILPERFSPLGGLGGLIRARFSLARFIEQDAIRRGGAPTPELIAAYRAAIPRRSTPPGRSPQHVLDDLLVHGQDIRRPLGLAWSYPPEVLIAVASTLHGDRAFGLPRRVRGLELTATDVQWTAGTGEPVTGPAEALILAMAGRPAALAELDGPGLSLIHI